MGRYEETLQVKPIGGATRNELGDWITESDSDFVTVSECRDEPNDEGNTLQGADGERVVYGSIVQLPEDCPDIERGQPVRVIDESGKVILEGEALRFKRYRKNCRLWV